MEKGMKMNMEISWNPSSQREPLSLSGYPPCRLSSNAQVLFLGERIELGGVGDKGRMLLRKRVAR